MFGAVSPLREQHPPPLLLSLNISLRGKPGYSLALILESLAVAEMMATFVRKALLYIRTPEQADRHWPSTMIRHQAYTPLCADQCDTHQVF